MNKLFCGKDLSRFMLFAVLILSINILTSNASLFEESVQNRDGVDPSFNAQIQTTTFLNKNVSHLIELPNGKILASGIFNKYNGTSVGGLIRLNSDATLDTSFNNDLLTFGSVPTSITPQPDGKILLHGSFKLSNGTNYTNTIVRLNSDGTVDSLFNYTYTGNIYQVRLDSNGRVLVLGFIHVNINGEVVDRSLIRLDTNGSVDSSFNAELPRGIERFSTQNKKILYTNYDNDIRQTRLSRLNEDGTADSSFNSTPLGVYAIYEIRVQHTNKILILAENNISQINENGGIDQDFQITTNFYPYQARKILLHNDGKITIAYGISTGTRVIRLLPNGTSDPSFTIYDSGNVAGHTVQSDGGLLIGESGSNSTSGLIRLLPSGIVDASFNPGGSGFVNIKPGKIGAISVFDNGKILIGGDFDKVNAIDRRKIARINSDGSLDTTFQIETSGNVNYFSTIADVYHFAIQNDGKIIASGNFTYFVNGSQKSNLVRLNSNGSIDPTFNLSAHIDDWFVATRLGKNKPLQRTDGKILVATSHPDLTNTWGIPLGLTGSGSKDTSFNPTTFNTKKSVAIHDMALLSNGKILIAGRHIVGNSNGVTLNGFIMRLNSDGTLDQSFQSAELVGKEIYAFTVLENSQILIVAGDNNQGKVFRLNADGTTDNSFNSGIGANGKINAISVLPDNKILVGGAFFLYHDEFRQNLAMLNADGTLSASLGDINDEVLCVTVDEQGRVLIGGRFTSISTNEQSLSSISKTEQQVSRSYVARFNVSPIESIRKTNFDFDGDGKSDPSIFRLESGVWHIQRSQSGYSGAQFGISTDKLVPADYDGDGKTDYAVFRDNTDNPNLAYFYVMNSSDNSVRAIQFGSNGDIPVAGDWDGDGKADIGVYRQGTEINPQGYFYYRPSSQPAVNFIPVPWGIAGDKPVIADYDGDGKTDHAVFRPSNGVWYVQQSRVGFSAIQFGATEDKPVAADYDGDGKVDQAVFRPSNGVWYIWNSRIGFAAAQFGISTDKPVPADYDGDGKTDIAVYRDGTWFISNSTNGFSVTNFGNSTDKPIANAFVP